MTIIIFSIVIIYGFVLNKCTLHAKTETELRSPKATYENLDANLNSFKQK